MWQFFHLLFYQVIYVTTAISNCSVNIHYRFYLNALFFYIKSIACKCSEMLFLHKSQTFITRLICKDKPTNRQIGRYLLIQQVKLLYYRSKILMARIFWYALPDVAAFWPYLDIFLAQRVKMKSITDCWTDLGWTR